MYQTIFDVALFLLTWVTSGAVIFATALVYGSAKGIEHESDETFAAFTACLLFGPVTLVCVAQAIIDHLRAVPPNTKRK